MPKGARVADALKDLIGEYPYIEKEGFCELRFKGTDVLKTDGVRRIRMFK